VQGWIYFMKEKSLLINPEIHTQFKVVCAQNNVLMKSVLEKLITQYINEKSVENKPNTSK
jgi:hypothetical protein